ncbi:MAG: putative glycosyltransferase [Ilumatobacteraceae bacterium]|nr:putative glycosyltransferase [Ilumatobacteraceae bacterium]
MTGRASGADAAGPQHHVCLVVPNGTHRAGALAQAVQRLHPDVRVGAIWCGDPHLRPAVSHVAPWLDTDADADWHEVLVADPPQVAEWRGALRATRRLIDAGAATVTVLWVGSVAVLADIAALWVDRPSVRLISRLTAPLPDDGAMPGDHELVAAGRFSPSVATFGPGSLAMIDWLETRLAADADGDLGASGRQGLGRWLEVAGEMFGADVCADPGMAVGAWRWDSTMPSLLEVPGYDSDAPWVLDRHVGHRARITVVGHQDRIDALAAATPQLEGQRQPLRAPGGLTIDDVIRRLARPPSQTPKVPTLAPTPLSSPRSRMPSPWDEPQGFRDWLADRYWSELHEIRRDLIVTFPRPTTNDAQAFAAWSRRAVIDDRADLLIPPIRLGASTTTTFESVDEPRTDGFNLTGYLRRESSLGDVARRLAAATAAANVPTALLAHERTASPLLPDPPASGRRIEFATTVAVVNADQFATIELDHPELVAATRRMIGYWFWELEHIPAAMRAVFASVDEIWAGSRFVVDAFAAVAAIPVRYVPIPVACPQPSDRNRSSFEPLAGVGDRFVFTVVFDHFSVTERKNPVGVIEAFRRAFAPDEGPVLVIKSMNGERRWPQHQQIKAAAAGRADIVVWDHNLSRPDHMAYIAAADALVSLHRSEGLGLHLAEAMWLGTPTIATRYSGNLDFMDDSNSLLVDAHLVPIHGGEGVYPPEAMWAEPDLDVAAQAMRRLATDAQLCAHLSAAGRAKMEAQPSLAHTGRAIAQLLHIEVTS